MIKNLFIKLFGSTAKHEEPYTKEQTAKKESGKKNRYQYPNGIQKLETVKSPKQILSEDFPEHDWPISGGWGYSMDDAVVIAADNEFSGVHMEYKFLEYRSYEEVIFSALLA